jgi:uncharacterized protein YbaR (Trm112 family)
LSISTNIIDIICCPVTRLPMEFMSEKKLHELNRLIRDSKLVSRDGVVLTAELCEALITRDGKLAYPIEDGIPVLLDGQGIMLSQLEST